MAQRAENNELAKVFASFNTVVNIRHRVQPLPS